jgi:hypothetical protein
MKLNKWLVTSILSISGLSAAFSQTSTDGSDGSRISTAVPFLLITPDARAGAMGDAGVAVIPDVNSTYWNPSKLVYLKDKYGFGLSYSPWLQKLVPDINLAYLNGYYRIDSRNVIGGSLRYFSLGDIQLTDNSGTPYSNYSPNELALDGSFARSFGENFSLGTAIRFIYSNLSSGQIDGSENKPGTALAADVSAFYQSDRTLFLGKEATLSLGLNISNIGTKMNYTDGGPKYFLPTNMRLGGASVFHLDEQNDFTFTVDINKLLVPSDPLSTKSVPAGIFGSFNDAPGGFKEEMQEINYGAGIEYWYNRQFALRAGYFYENPDKGNRQYLTVGGGLRYNIVNIDFSYLIADQQKSPLANTLRFSLVFNFGEAGSATQSMQ